MKLSNFLASVLLLIASQVAYADPVTCNGNGSCDGATINSGATTNTTNNAGGLGGNATGGNATTYDTKTNTIADTKESTSVASTGLVTNDTTTLGQANVLSADASGKVTASGALGNTPVKNKHFFY